MKDQLPYTIYKEKIDELEKKVEYYEQYIKDIHSSLGWKLICRARNNQFFYNLTKPARTFIRNFEKYKSKQNLEYIATIKKTLLDIPEKSVIAICHEEWMGVRHSTEALFENRLLVKEIYSEKEASIIANLICKKYFKCIIFSGFAEGYQLLIKKMKKLNPSTKIMVFWHGNTTHMYEDYSWYRNCEVIKLYQEGLISKVGFAKSSMAELYKKVGIESEFVMNYVSRDITSSVKYIDQQNIEDIKIGLYASGNTWNKNAYTQIAAARFIENSVVNAIPCNDRMRNFSRQIGVKIEGTNNAIPRKTLLQHMKNNTINFYVTFSECAPLLPLESLNLGVPCITGPNHHYFDNHPLYDYLVVEKPDDPTEIARKAKIAIQKSDEIIRLYENWYNENYYKVKESIQRFVGEMNE